MTVFTLGRMRHLDLLALWCYLHPDAHGHHVTTIAGMTPGHLAAAILSSP